MGLGWALFGLTIIYMGYLAALVAAEGTWSNSFSDLPPAKRPNADLEAAGKH